MIFEEELQSRNFPEKSGFPAAGRNAVPRVDFSNFLNNCRMFLIFGMKSGDDV